MLSSNLSFVTLKFFIILIRLLLSLCHFLSMTLKRQDKYSCALASCKLSNKIFFSDAYAYFIISYSLSSCSVDMSKVQKEIRCFSRRCASSNMIEFLFSSHSAQFDARIKNAYFDKNTDDFKAFSLVK